MATSTLTEVITGLVESGVIAADATAAARTELRAAADKAGVKLTGLGSKFVPQLGGVVTTSVELPLSEDTWDMVFAASPALSAL